MIDKTNIDEIAYIAVLKFGPLRYEMVWKSHPTEMKIALEIPAHEESLGPISPEFLAPSKSWEIIFYRALNHYEVRNGNKLTLYADYELARIE